MGGIQAATAAQSRTRIAARLYAIDAVARKRGVSPRGPIVQLCSEVSVLSEHQLLRLETERCPVDGV